MHVRIWSLVKLFLDEELYVEADIQEALGVDITLLFLIWPTITKVVTKMLL